MPHICVEIRQHHKILAFALTGFVISVLFMGRMGEEVRQLIPGCGQNALSQLDKGSAWVIIISRMFLLLLCIGLSFTALGTIALSLSWVYMGFSVGVMLWIAVCVVGWRGPFVLWALVFPQYLCYLPALLLIYIGCLRRHDFQRIHKHPVSGMKLVPEIKMFFLRILLGTVLYGLGIWTELRINPWFLKKIYNFVRIL